MKWINAYDLLPGDVLGDGKIVRAIETSNDPKNPYSRYNVELLILSDGTEVTDPNEMQFPLKSRGVLVGDLEKGDKTVYGVVSRVSQLRYPGEIHVEARIGAGILQKMEFPAKEIVWVNY